MGMVTETLGDHTGHQDSMSRAVYDLKIMDFELVIKAGWQSVLSLSGRKKSVF